MENLLNKKENGWKKVDEKEKQIIFEYCQKYIDFLNKSKTEREFIKNAKKMVEENGFKDIAEYTKLKNRRQSILYKQK